MAKSSLLMLGAYILTGLLGLWFGLAGIVVVSLGIIDFTKGTFNRWFNIGVIIYGGILLLFAKWLVAKSVKGTRGRYLVPRISSGSIAKTRQKK